MARDKRQEQRFTAGKSSSIKVRTGYPTPLQVREGEMQLWNIPSKGVYIVSKFKGKLRYAATTDNP